MCALLNPAIIVLLVCFGGNGVGAQRLGDWEKFVNLPTLDDMYRVTMLALPKIEKDLGISSMDVLNFVKAKDQVVAGYKWEITIHTKGTYGQTARQDEVTFTVDQPPPEKCPDYHSICIKDVFIVDVDPPNSGATDPDDLVGGLQPVPNFKRFQVLYLVTRQVLELLRIKWNLDYLKLADFVDAEYQLGQGTNWKITADAIRPSIYTKIDINKIYFEVFQPLPENCKPRGPICVNFPTKVVVNGQEIAMNVLTDDFDLKI